MTPKQFQKSLLKWYDQQGRTHLPWRENITPYRVWISEIMLQQTQVKTVIPYFENFMQHFPNIEALAQANQDIILHLWTGLGYYSRARNLHKTAQIIAKKYHGKFPNTIADLEALPGIGRSTAGAILSIAMQQPTPILDGNVKRVLTRVNAIIGWPEKSETLKQLWSIAEKYTPAQRCDDYAQAIMDLGATICTRSKPNCTHCPLQSGCLAHQQNLVNTIPTAKPNKKLPVKTTHFLIMQNDQGEILLEKRPPVGIWGGLWSFPECAPEENVTHWCQQRYGYKIISINEAAKFRHTFSHYHLDIVPVHMLVSNKTKHIMDGATRVWYNTQNPLSLGLAAPVKKLLHGKPS